jgi:glycosyltransferase involved in cell wall biosynthesis
VSEPLLSVVVPFFNDETTLPELLEALANETWTEPWEVILCDNGSTDGSRTVIESFVGSIPGLRVVDATEHRGASFARNVGLRAAAGERVAFCDADDLIASGWVEAIGTALAENAFVASRHDATLLNPEWMVKARGSTQVEGLYTTWYPPYLPHAGACGMGAHRDILLDAGGFDLRFLCCQDTELSLRLQAKGVQLHFSPDAMIHIRFREGLRRMFCQARRWAIYNEAVYARHGDGEVIDRAWRTWFRGWRRIGRQTRRARTRIDRYRVAWQIGWHIGLLQGSLKYGVPPVSDFSRARLVS